MAGARTSKLLLLVLVVALLGLAAVTSGLLGSAQAGKTITVGPSGCDFTTIQAAIEAAPNGSIIQVQTGSYKENLTIRNKDGLTLQGPGPDAVTLDGNGPGQKDVTPGILVLGSRNVAITGLRITNCRTGLEADDSKLVFIEKNSFDQNFLTGIYLLRSEARLAENSVRGTQRDVGNGNRGDGILLSSSSRATLLQNVIAENADCGLRTEIEVGQDSPQVTGSGNTITGNRGGDLSGDVPTSLLAQPLPEGTQAQVNVPLDVPTIQAAVERVQSGGTIVVGAGAFQQSVQSGPVQIYKSLKIVGAGSGKTVLQAPGPEWAVLNVATNGLEVVLEGLTVTGGRRGVQVNTGAAASLTLRDVAVEKNGAGKGNDFGLRVSGDVKLVLDRATISQNGGIGLTASLGQPNIQVRESTIADNAYGVALQSGATATMEGSAVSRNGGYGVYALATSVAKLANCTVSDNGRYGVRVAGSAEVTIADSRVTGTKVDADGKYGRGIWFSGESKGAVRACTLSGNAFCAIALSDSSAGTIDGTTITDNFVEGILVDGNAQAQIAGSQIRTTKPRAGFEDWGVGVNLLGGQATLEQTTVSDNESDGVLLQKAFRADVTDCVIERNRAGGVSLIGDSAANIANCTVSDNGSYGIRAAGSAEITAADTRVVGTKPKSDGSLGFGIYLQGSAMATVTACGISGNRYGIYIVESSAAQVRDCSIADSARYGVRVRDSSTLTLTGSQVTGGTGDGSDTYIYGSGVLLGDTGTATLQDCTVERNHMYGLSISGNAQVKILGGAVRGNAGEGVYITGTASVEISNLEVSETKQSPGPSSCCGSGIVGRGDSRVTIRGGTIARNAEAGVWIDDNAQVSVTGSTISNNQQGGIGVLRAAQAVIADCTLSWNLGVGVGAGGTCNVTLTNNRITGTLKGAAPYEGFGVGLAETCRATIRGNTITGNASHGICVGTGIQKEALNAELSSNTIQNNKGYGVYADSDSGIKVTGQGNTVSGNTKGQLGGTTSKLPKGFGGGK